MDKKYWDEVALEHDEKIFDVFSNDLEKTIQSSIKKYSSREKSVMDLGCAIGNWLPLLSSSFKKVYAIDISEHYIDMAKEKNSHLDNVEYIHADLSRDGKDVPVSDNVVCINTLLTSNSKNRKASYETVVNKVAKNGHLFLVVPSLESALYSEYILDCWDLKDKGEGKRITKSEKVGDPFGGIIELDGTPTKHYLKEELVFLLQNSGFKILQTDKVEYRWETEFNEPPAWLKSPLPWDWLVVAKRTE
jgi:2-polyprenyl-3-methyl-5-hydroxy-6-metoxy-1,4-benzoquinol methylase